MCMDRGKIKISVKASLICQIHADFVVHQRLFKFGQVCWAWRFYSLPFKSYQQFLHQRSRFSVPWRDFFCFKKIDQAGPLGHRNVKLAHAQCSQRNPDPQGLWTAPPAELEEIFFSSPNVYLAWSIKLCCSWGMFVCRSVEACAQDSWSPLWTLPEGLASAFLTRRDMVTGPGPDGHMQPGLFFPFFYWGKIYIT